MISGMISEFLEELPAEQLPGNELVNELLSELLTVELIGS